MFDRFRLSQISAVFLESVIADIGCFSGIGIGNIEWLQLTELKSCRNQKFHSIIGIVLESVESIVLSLVKFLLI